VLELTDMEAVEADHRECLRLADELRQPYILWQVANMRGMWALLEGRFDEVEQLAQEAFAIGQQAENPNAVALFGVQIMALRREQGRLDELEPAMRSFIDQYPGIPGWRIALAWVYTELGQEDEARAEHEVAAAHDFADLPWDQFWIGGVALACEVCNFLDDRRRARVLYERVLPYADRCLVAAPVAACYGAVARHVALVATTLGRFDDAVALFETALEVNTRIGSRPWVAHSQHGYARACLARARPGDADHARELVSEADRTAAELGMKALHERMRASGLLELGATA
jgi:tetratricopeptide (TPR) repeat protein